jgi:predicted nuclease of restriction endonuclease-like (RecB) superfamily
MAASLTQAGFVGLLKEVKTRIAQAQARAVLSVNAELVRLYWDIGRIIDLRQQEEGWGAGVIPRLADELRNELPEVKGFSERNIGRMIAFHRAYPDPTPCMQQPAARFPAGPILPPPVAKLPAADNLPQAVAKMAGLAFWSVPWAHHVILMEKVKDLPVRLWYMEQVLANGWSRNVLQLMIKTSVHRRQGKAITNFERLLPAPQSDLVQQALKDPYIFDFLTRCEA